MKVILWIVIIIIVIIVVIIFIFIVIFIVVTGDLLILTKGIGTGVILAADMRANAKGEWVEEAFNSMVTFICIYIHSYMYTCVYAFILFAHIHTYIHT